MVLDIVFWVTWTLWILVAVGRVVIAVHELRGEPRCKWYAEEGK